MQESFVLFCSDTGCKYLENHEIVLEIYFDLQKAFDKLDHEFLLYKLYTCGVCGNIICIYVSQFISVSVTVSEMCTKNMVCYKAQFLARCCS